MKELTLKEVIVQLDNLLESIKNGERDIALAQGEYEAIEEAVEYLQFLSIVPIAKMNGLNFTKGNTLKRLF